MTIAQMSYGVSVFRYSGYLRVRSLVLASRETPKYETPKRYSVTRIYWFGVLAPGISRGKSLVLASPEILTCETPKWHSVSRVWMFRSFGTWETQVRNPPVLAYREIPMDETPK
jgi:hypothetical protein